MFKKILVPLDGSKVSLKELDFAKEIGMKFSSTLFITTIIDPTIEVPAGVPPVGAVAPVQAELGARENAKRIIEDAKTQLSNNDILANYTIVSGVVSQEIATNLPKKNDIDLILIGRSGKNALEQLIVGSVTKYVIQHAEVPVLVIE
ncbi:Universal stress protein family protein [Lactiplantibacillus plantarum]|uniref:universal stress protein n=1 Tax=Lactiplantibacillus plantarum TaxID=1590 RepID=UPI000D0F1CBE|nr:universal stress protein [Lactiplantibacillus plantarum]SPH08616.1 Universal stress protein family protein [Lactiplantibacillus plantarum]